MNTAYSKQLLRCFALLSFLTYHPQNASTQSPHPFADDTSPTSKTVDITIQHIDSTPHRLLIVRGTVLRFSGKLSADAGDIVVSIKMGELAVASGIFNEKWQLDWDTTKIPEGIKFVWVVMGKKNQVPSVVAKYNVEFVSTNPFRMDAQAIADQPGKVHITFARKTTVPLRYRLFLDGDDTGSVVTGSKDSDIVDMSVMVPGLRRLGAVAQLEDCMMELDEVPITLPHFVEIEPINSSNTVEVLKAPKQIDLVLRPKEGIVCTEMEGFLDGKSFGVTSTADGIPLKLSLRPSTLASGIHKIYFKTHTGDGKTLLTPYLPLNIVRDPLTDYIQWNKDIQLMMGEEAGRLSVTKELIAKFGANQKVVEGLAVQVNKTLAWHNLIERTISAKTPPLSLSKEDRDDTLRRVQTLSRAFYHAANADRRLLDYIEIAEKPSGGGGFSGNRESRLEGALRLVEKAFKDELEALEKARFLDLQISSRLNAKSK